MKINRTTSRAIDICKLLSTHPEGLSLDDICTIMDIPKTSAYDIVVTLVECGMLELNRGRQNKYQIGLTAYRIGMSYINHRDISEILEPELKAFASQIGKTVFFGIRDSRHVVYISKFEPPNPIITTATVGSRNPIYCTSLGKAILAYEEDAEAIIDTLELKRLTPKTITNKQDLIKDLKRVKKRGYAMDEREMEDHMECVGAPIFNQEGKVIGAISASSLYKSGEDYQRLGEQIAAKARQISISLGYSY